MQSPHPRLRQEGSLYSQRCQYSVQYQCGLPCLFARAVLNKVKTGKNLNFLHRLADVITAYQEGAQERWVRAVRDLEGFCHHAGIRSGRLQLTLRYARDGPSRTRFEITLSGPANRSLCILGDRFGHLTRHPTNHCASCVELQVEIPEALRTPWFIRAVYTGVITREYEQNPYSTVRPCHRELLVTVLQNDISDFLRLGKQSRMANITFGPQSVWRFPTHCTLLM